MQPPRSAAEPVSGAGRIGLPVFGIVGGIGSGKSSIARRAAEFDPALRVYDADEAGHRALRTAEVRDQLTARFGPRILAPDGDVDRRRLAEIVFADETARQDLEAIVHPAIRRDFEQRLAHWEQDGAVRAVLLDAAVLLEAGWGDACRAVAYVDVPREERLRRVAARGWDDAELSRREASQWPLNAKRDAADFVIRNDATLDIAGRELYEYIHQALRSPA
ncbi:MAG: dephospho-CoA kinase [Planctomyces sp.]|nr:dephospho-CoA kinase [Planctomyces sp.]